MRIGLSHGAGAVLTLVVAAIALPTRSSAQTTGTSTTPASSASLEARALATCGRSDKHLTKIAGELAALHDRTMPDALARIQALQRAYGEPHVWPRIWRGPRRSSDRALLEDLSTWFASWPTVGEFRCGVASSTGELVVVAAEALADWDAVPGDAAVGSSLEIRARLLVAARGARVLVQDPRGFVREAPVVLVGSSVRTRVVIDQPGAFTLQMVLNLAGGPRPVLETVVFGGGDRRTDAIASDAGDGSLRGVMARVNALRVHRGVRPLRADETLDNVATAHAIRARDTRTVAHDLGDGTLGERLARAGLVVSAGGENMAQSATLDAAQQALERSPSHFAAMTNRVYDAIGLGVATDNEGSVFLVQVFAATLSTR